MKVVRIEYNTDYMQKVMSTFWRSWYLGITEDQRNSILYDVQFSINEDLQSPSDIEDYVECLLDGRSWLEYLNYIMVYKDMIIPKDKGILQFDGAVSKNYDLVLNLGSSPDYLPKNISYFNCRDLNKFISGLYINSSCNCLVEFRGFDQICEIYNLIRAHISDIDQSEYERLQRIKSEEKYNNIIHSQKL